MRPSCADQRLATAAVALVVIASGAMAGCDTHRNDSGLISVPGGRLWGARFSPAGDTLAVAYGPDDKIGTIDLGSSSLREVTAGASYLTGTAWSAAGDAIYYTGTAGVYRVEPGGPAPTMVNDAFASLGVDVSPDGALLAYGINGSDARIYTVATMSERALDRPCQAIRFAPSGDRVACISGGALVNIELASGTVTPIVAAGLPFIAGVDWYSDGQRLVFTSTQGIETVTLAGERKVLAPAFAAVEVDLAPDDSAIVYGVNGANGLTLIRY